MLIKELIDLKRVKLCEGFDNWEDAIEASCEPLLEDGSIEKSYVEAVINCVKKYGPYIVFAPNIAMPHSQEGAVGVNDTAISFMKVEKAVSFEEGNPEKDAKLFFVLASKDHEVHMKNMEKLAQMLLTNGIMDELLEAKNIEDLLAIDAKYSK
ncbi:PTS sugar transporter subunit IIA [Sporanaerobium hydrogeniformans]|uniref:PTS sugar transporter subunit IIA n=1 Tax=Sporanaerobium hydrogeniformans TaxID=3072179 RepID=A0AC61D9G8_9FIRM|nr:PTS sugar transporter subunit IIA [Sporanaerobium hydrogeniformans]PHV69657.1 PTS sugar transporter subunit IIA [Sporanaerobium hydrogeniformans]